MWSFPSENPLRRCLKGSQKSGSVPIFRIVLDAGPGSNHLFGLRFRRFGCTTAGQ